MVIARDLLEGAVGSYFVMNMKFQPEKPEKKKNLGDG
jgi:hypothetical protein